MPTVTAIEPAVEFCRHAPGFACVSGVDERASMAPDDAEVMVALPNAHPSLERPLMTGPIYSRVEGVDGWWEQLRGQRPG